MLPVCQSKSSLEWLNVNGHQWVETSFSTHLCVTHCYYLSVVLEGYIVSGQAVPVWTFLSRRPCMSRRRDAHAWRRTEGWVYHNTRDSEGMQEGKKSSKWQRADVKSFHSIGWVTCHPFLRSGHSDIFYSPQNISELSRKATLELYCRHFYETFSIPEVPFGQIQAIGPLQVGHKAPPPFPANTMCRSCLIHSSQ